MYHQIGAGHHSLQYGMKGTFRARKSYVLSSKIFPLMIEMIFQLKHKHVCFYPLLALIIIRMKNRALFFQLLIAILICSCNNSSTENNDHSFQIETSDTSVINNPNGDSINDFQKIHNVAKENNDSIITPMHSIKVNDKVLKRNSIDNWSIDDFIIKCPESYKGELKSDIEYVKEQWKNVETPIIVFYRGNDFGDYFHLNFEDENGKKYDFGFGNNSYGEYVLFENSGHYEDVAKYLDKKFKVHWDWRASSFPCCSGEYEVVEAYLPSITKLELISN